LEPQIRIRSERKKSSAERDATGVPKVTAAPPCPSSSSVLVSSWIPSSMRSSRSTPTRQVAEERLPPGPSTTASESPLVTASISASATSASASSQLTRFQRPDPRSPIRRSGWRSRSGAYIRAE
jgi:hypothetical protein